MNFQVICPTHGTVVVLDADLFLDTDRTSYRFRCYACSKWIVKEADRSVRDLLLKHGALVDVA